MWHEICQSYIFATIARGILGHVTDLVYKFNWNINKRQVDWETGKKLKEYREEVNLLLKEKNDDKLGYN